MSEPAHLVATGDKSRFLRALEAHDWEEQTLILGNPGWSLGQWKEAMPLGLPTQRTLDPHLETLLAPLPSLKVPPKTGSVYLATGGSSGGIRLARHTQATLAASAAGYAAFWGAAATTTFCVLPLWHIAGLMQWERARWSGKRFVPLDWAHIKTGEALPDVPCGAHLSLVPAQLHDLLLRADTTRWLSHFEVLLIGAAAVSATLLERASQLGLRVALSYGLTEAAATVAITRPEAVASGQRQWADVLPHWTATQAPDGCLSLSGPALFKGYYGHEDEPQKNAFNTRDLVQLNDRGQLRVLGRADRLIRSGGETIDPALVEAASLCTGLCIEACALGLDDARWGQRCVLAVVLKPGATASALQQATENSLAPWVRPKDYFILAELPKTDTGKLNYGKLKAQLETDRPDRSLKR
jgi:O-succinylbenzoic acid--CoA ligase